MERVYRRRTGDGRSRMSETTTDADLASRRAVLAGAAGVGVAAALAACSDNSSSSGGNPGTNPGGTTGESTGGDTGASIAKKSDIPEGGGKIFPQERVVITQPTAGTFKAFDATCQHQFCLVTSVTGGTINCDCHGSKYGLADGGARVTRAPQQAILTYSRATLDSVPGPSTYRPAAGTIPDKPGVYRFRDASGRVIYVGKAKSLRQRLNSYFADHLSLHARTQQMVTSASGVDWVMVGTEVEALQLEYAWISVPT